MKAFYDGNDCWSLQIVSGLTKITVQDNEYDIYKDMPTSLYASLYRAQKLYPDKCCIIDDNNKRYTYKEFFILVENFARSLFHKYGVSPKQHVGVLLYNSIEFCVTIYALNKLGAVAVPLPTKYKQLEIENLLIRANLSGIIFHADFKDYFANNDDIFKICMDITKLNLGRNMLACPDYSFELTNPAVMMFTSGTTSQSKIVLMANYNIMHAIAIYQKIFNITENDRTLLSVPAYHVTGLIAIMGLFVHCGACLWLHKFFNAERVLETMKKYKLTFFHASPTVFSLLLAQKDLYPKLPAMRLMACGSGNMPKSKIKQLKAWLPKIQFRTVYGLTETTSPATIFPNDASNSPYIGSSGKIIPGMKIAICDEQGKCLPTGEVGTIMLKGTTVAVGYYQNNANLTINGWLDTGDIGYINKEGYLYITDRKKDMINRGGEKICSFDIENLLTDIAGISEAAVVGIADEQYGEVAAAMIVVDKNFDLNQAKIQAILKQEVAKYKNPTKIIFVDKLPLTCNGKVDKRTIREILQAK